MKNRFCVSLMSGVLVCAVAVCLAPAAHADFWSDAAASAYALVRQMTGTEAALADGVYKADFETDSKMFRANDACDGKGELTVSGGKMTFHVSLVSKSVQKLYVGTAADAEKASEGVLEPTLDTVTYSDGSTEEVYGFDIPVDVLDEDFELAILGKKGSWYDHKVSVRNASLISEENTEGKAASAPALADGAYTCAVALEGGSGKAKVESPAQLTVSGGKVTATIVWSSKNYDYMLVDGEKYLPVNTEGNSTFEIPVSGFDSPLAVVGDTVAMSRPHEVEYTLTFDSSTIRAAG